MLSVKFGNSNWPFFRSSVTFLCSGLLVSKFDFRNSTKRIDSFKKPRSNDPAPPSEELETHSGTMNKYRHVLLLALLSAIVLPGCVIVGVNYEEPGVTVPDVWTNAISGDLRKGSNIEKWWKGFQDPVLNKLIERARNENPDFRIAGQRILQARSQRGIAYSAMLPNATANGSFSRNRQSENQTGFGAFPPNPSDLYATGFDSGWEIDIFGGLRRNVESTDASYQASIESYRDLLVTLFADTALNYVEYRTLQRQIRVAEENVEIMRNSMKIAQGRLDAGLVSKIDVTQARTNLETTRSIIPQLRGRLAAAKNRLATLTGGYPASVEGLLAGHRSIPVPRRGFSAGLPTDLIRARPDVRAAERNLAAATARIGVAEADLYPRFTLFGNFALTSLSASNFLDASSTVYSFGPSIRWQIFTAGRIRNNIRIEESRTEEALAAYERSILGAVEEVETGMAAVANEWDRLAALRRASAASQESVDLVGTNYKDGLVDFQRVLDSERVKFQNENQAVISRGQLSRNYILLYKALGGGSQVENVPIPEPTDRSRDGIFGQKKKNNANPEKPLP